MSYTTLMAAFEDGEMQYIYPSFQNSWRSAMWIWNQIAKKYFGMKGFPLFSLEEGQKVWDIAYSNKIEENDRLALLTTYDYHLVSKEHLERVAVALENFSPGTENLVGQAKAIREHANNGARAIGWHQTSTSSNLWVSCKDDEEIFYNIDTGTKHIWIVPRGEKII